MYIVSGTTAVVIVVIGAIVVFAVGGGGGGGGGHKAPTAPGETPGTYAIAPALQKKVESVALSALVAEAKAEPSGTTPPARLAATAPPLTVDGKPEVVVQEATAYQRLLDLAAEADEDQAIQRGLEDMHAGRTRPLDEVFDEMRERYAIQR